MTSFKNIMKTLSKIVGIFFILNAFFLFLLFMDSINAFQYQFDIEILLKTVLNIALGFLFFYFGRRVNYE
tara:strand:- start:204 stop:413 length:210 start_codon:yes stop_codon:yes gene_type:complete